MEEYEFEGTLSEQKALVFSLIKMSKKFINIIYKKCFNFTEVRQKNKPQNMNSFASIITFSMQNNAKNGPKVTEVLWKDTLWEQKAYTHMV
jgi:hypothetical protein